MIALSWRLFRASGWGRSALMAACTAIVSGLFLVGAAVLQLRGYPTEPLFDVVANPDTRGGYTFAIALLSLPSLLLLYQAVRLGSADRERRLAGLRLAGATPAQVRRIGATLVGIPVFLGAVAGLGVYWSLRELLGRDWSYVDDHGPGFELRASLRLVPTTVTPTWWQVLLVIAVVTLIGVGVGLWAGRGVIVSPLGVTRRVHPRPPRPWGAIPLVLVPVFGIVYVGAYSQLGEAAALLLAITLLSMLVLGMLALAPWVASTMGRLVASRARTAPVLIAGRRLAAEPRTTGRAASAVGAIGLVAGGSAGLVADLVSMDSNGDRVHYVAIALVGIALLAALVAVIGSLTVHSIESLLDHKRSVASLVAFGASPDLLVRTQRWETGIATVPMALGGCVFGAVVVGAGGDVALFWWLVCTAAALLALAVLIAAAVLAASWLTRPWTLRAADPANLRTA